jgi:serine protease inhibitor ecotin
MGKEIQRLHFETAVLGSASLPFFNSSLPDVHFTVENVDRTVYFSIKVHDGYRIHKYRVKE